MNCIWRRCLIDPTAIYIHIERSGVCKWRLVFLGGTTLRDVFAALLHGGGSHSDSDSTVRFADELHPSAPSQGELFRCPCSYPFLRKQQEDPNKGQGQVRAISRLYPLPRGGGPGWGQGIKLFRHSNTFIKDISSPPGYSTPPFFRGGFLYIPAPIRDWFCCNRAMPSR